MKRKGYQQFIIERVNLYPQNTPIYTVEIARTLAIHFKLDFDHARGLVNVTLPRIAEKYDVVRYRKGVYYRAQKTVFGRTKLNPALVNRDRYINQFGKVIGYETGAAFLNRIGLTTQIPKYKKYATNQFKHRGTRTDKNLQVIIRKPKLQVTTENYEYLQVLDAIENKDRVAFDHPEPEKVLYAYITKKELDIHKLFKIAEENYNQNTRNRIFRMVAVGLIETSFR